MLLISTPPHLVPENSLCAPLSLPTIVQWRVSGGVGTASVWGRTETSNGSFCRTNPNTFSPQSLLASFQMVCVIHNIRLISHEAVRCPYLWVSWPAVAACWWFGGRAAERRAASGTRPPSCECAAYPRSWRTGARRSPVQRHSHCLCCHLQDGSMGNK